MNGKGPGESLAIVGMTNAPCWIRTNDRLLRRQLLYPAELRELTDQTPGQRPHLASSSA